MWIYVAFAVCVSTVTGLPPQRSQRQSPPAQQASQSSTPIPIINQTEVIGVNGTFNFSYETGNGIKVEESGYLKEAPHSAKTGAEEENQPIQVIQGSYSYTAPNGEAVHLKYIADEKGFQPEGDHIPTTPPVPEPIKRALALSQAEEAPNPETAADSSSYYSAYHYQ